MDYADHSEKSKSFSGSIPPKITVIFPLYHAEKMIPDLVGGLVRQFHRNYERQDQWLEAIFIDNASSDATVEVLETYLKNLGSPAQYQIISNKENLGLSRSLNKAFQMAKAPIAVTCHSDCRFGRDDYLAEMLRYFDENEKAAAITGQTSLEKGRPLSLTEKVNLITNLMDIFPSGSKELVPVGFAEGRCDGFRVSALREIGFYDTTLRLAGEDQLLAGQLREKGYEILQATRLRYYLSLSVQQDSIGKLVTHQRRFGRAHSCISGFQGRLFLIPSIVTRERIVALVCIERTSSFFSNSLSHTFGDSFLYAERVSPKCFTGDVWGFLSPVRNENHSIWRHISAIRLKFL